LICAIANRAQIENLPYKMLDPRRPSPQSAAPRTQIEETGGRGYAGVAGTPWTAITAGSTTGSVIDLANQ
jgi:hypothetical protein